MDLDSDNNVYLTGNITGTTTVEGKEMKSDGLRDILVTKVNPEGKTEWMKQFGAGKPEHGGKYANDPASDLEDGNLICVDENNNIYFSGIHYDGTKFDNITLHTDAALGSYKIGTIFIAKLNASGKVQWAKNAESKKSSAAMTGLVCDNNGSVYLSAVIGFKKAKFDGVKAKGAFIAKFNTDGTLGWIHDADIKSFWSSTKITITMPGGLAISKDNNYLYATGNATKVDSDSNYLTGISTTTTSTIIAVSKTKIN